MAYTFVVTTGRERYKVVDLDTGGEAFFDDLLHAYARCAILKRLGRSYRLESRW